MPKNSGHGGHGGHVTEKTPILHREPAQRLVVKPESTKGVRPPEVGRQLAAPSSTAQQHSWYEGRLFHGAMFFLSLSTGVLLSPLSWNENRTTRKAIITWVLGVYVEDEIVVDTEPWMYLISSAIFSIYFAAALLTSLDTRRTPAWILYQRTTIQSANAIFFWGLAELAGLSEINLLVTTMVLLLCTAVADMALISQPVVDGPPANGVLRLDVEHAKSTALATCIMIPCISLPWVLLLTGVVNYDAHQTVPSYTFASHNMRLIFVCVFASLQLIVVLVRHITNNVVCKGFSHNVVTHRHAAQIGLVVEWTLKVVFLFSTFIADAFATDK